MQIIKKHFLILLVALPMAAGQGSFVGSADDSSITIQGTSSLHDWEESVNEFTIKGVRSEEDLLNVEIKIKTKSIKSGKSIMDSKTYDALLAEKHPWISFRAENMKISGQLFSGNGTLKIAGKEKNIPVSGSLDTQSPEQMQVSGTLSLKMTDFGIDPPTAMFGTMVTGNEIAIAYQFKLNYQK